MSTSECSRGVDPYTTLSSAIDTTLGRSSSASSMACWNRSWLIFKWEPTEAVLAKRTVESCQKLALVVQGNAPITMLCVELAEDSCVSKSVSQLFRRQRMTLTALRWLVATRLGVVQHIDRFVDLTELLQLYWVASHVRVKSITLLRVSILRSWSSKSFRTVMWVVPSMIWSIKLSSRVVPSELHCCDCTFNQLM